MLGRPRRDGLASRLVGDRADAAATRSRLGRLAYATSFTVEWRRRQRGSPAGRLRRGRRSRPPRAAGARRRSTSGSIDPELRRGRTRRRTRTPGARGRGAGAAGRRAVRTTTACTVGGKAFAVRGRPVRAPAEHPGRLDDEERVARPHVRRSARRRARRSARRPPGGRGRPTRPCVSGSEPERHRVRGVRRPRRAARRSRSARAEREHHRPAPAVVARAPESLDQIEHRRLERVRVLEQQHHGPCRWRARRSAEEPDVDVVRRTPTRRAGRPSRTAARGGRRRGRHSAPAAVLVERARAARVRDRLASSSSSIPARSADDRGGRRERRCRRRRSGSAR